MDSHKVILNLDGYQLLGEEYFTLRLVRIGPDEEWLSRNGGLQLLFPRAGSGKFLVGSNVHRLAPGDAFVIGGGDARQIKRVRQGRVCFLVLFAPAGTFLSPLCGS